MKLHILTAVTRPENLAEIEASIDAAQARAKNVQVFWWHRPDPNREHVGGQWIKNKILAEIDLMGLDGWVCILDDDTIMHPRFMQKIEIVLATQALAQREINAIVVSQRRVNGTVLRASPENAVLGKIDAGQAVMRRSFIGDIKIPETYAGDGVWLEALLLGRDDVHYMSEVLSLHNAISGIDVGPPQEVEA